MMVWCGKIEPISRAVSNRLRHSNTLVDSRIVSVLEPVFDRKRTEQVSAGITTHVLIVNRGEDVVQKTLLLVRDIPSISFILSANGNIATVKIGPPQTPGRMISYEGNFTLLSLRGTFMPVKDGYHQSRASGLSVSFAGQDAQVLVALLKEL